tara:strand:+ start:436 stop:1161 length:726 start_codon:yes stop_codon:yes gene_type:complete
MIYFYHGEDSLIQKKKAKAFIDILIEKKPEASLRIIEEGPYSETLWDETLLTHGLFVEQLVVYVPHCCADKEALSFIEKNIKDFASSNNIFIFVERGLTKRTLQKFEKHAKKYIVDEKKDVKERKQYNLFSLTNALGERDKKRAWVELERAYAKNISPEEVHPLMFWQMKTILQVKRAEEEGNSEALNMKPFVYNKARNFSRKFTRKELEEKVKDLVHKIDNARQGEGDLSMELLSFALSV